MRGRLRIAASAILLAAPALPVHARPAAERPNVLTHLRLVAAPGSLPLSVVPPVPRPASRPPARSGSAPAIVPPVPQLAHRPPQPPLPSLADAAAPLPPAPRLVRQGVQLAALAPERMDPALWPEPRPEPRPPRRDAKSERMLACLSPAARALFDRIEAEHGPMRVISTCRPGARIAGSGRISKHASGEAIDFEAGGRKAQVVRWLIANHKRGGTMTYSDMSHIHVDIGHHFVALGAPSGR